jgi:signal transduction histidine kinase/ligand-binding sensor domain-containing protein
VSSWRDPRAEVAQQSLLHVGVRAQMLHLLSCASGAFKRTTVRRRQALRVAVAGAACLLLIEPCARALVAGTDLSQFGRRSWRYEEGYFIGMPLSIAQTTDGYLWIGTTDGLERFDGLRFVVQTFPKGESLPSRQIQSLLAARDGSLWIGTARGLARFAHGKLTNYPEVGAGRIFSMRENRDGTIWVSNIGLIYRGRSLCKIKGAVIRCFGLAQGLGDRGEAVALDSEGFVWLGTDTDLERWSPATQRVARYSLPALRNNAGMDGVMALAVGQRGSIWAGTSSGRSDPGLLKFADGRPVPFRHSGLSLNGLVVYALFVDTNGSLWIGTAKRGIYRLEDGRAENFRDADGLTGSFVRGTFEDREGNIWVLTSDGVNCFYDIPVLRLSKQDGLDVDEVDGVHATGSGEVLIGTPEGLKVLDSRTGLIRADTALPKEQISGIYQDHRGRFWVGVDDQLYIQSGDHATRVVAPGGAPFGVSVPTEDGAGVMWVEALRHGQWQLNRLRGDRVEAVFSAEQAPAARSIAGDPHGGVWIGLNSGDLAHRDGTRLEVFRFPHRANDTVHEVIIGPNEAVLAASTFGLVGLRDRRERILSTRNGLPCPDVFSLVFDKSGSLWMLTECGLVTISARELTRWWADPRTRIQLHVYDATQGVQSGQSAFQGAARSTDGRLWFANGIDVQTVDPAHLTRNSIPPPVQIEQLIADRHRYAAGSELQLPPLTENIEIHYTALSFVAPQKVRFRYMLEPHDLRWIDALGRRQAFYNSLPPGRYRFRVIASNNDGVWNLAGTALSFSIMPTYYQTAWFKIACALAGTLVLWAIILVRVRQATAAVRMRLGERLIERERIARELHDTLLQGFQGLLLRFHAVIKQLSRPEAAKALLESTLSRADEVVTEARLRVRDLLPDEDSPADVAQALGVFGRLYAEGASVDYRVLTVGAPRELEPVSSRELIRAGREAVTNAFLHSRATRVVAEVHYGNSTLTLIVKDDGQGMPTDLKRNGRAGHWGLRSMRAAATALGGTLSITDQEPSGTIVTVAVPGHLAYAKAARSPLRRLLRRIKIH